MAMTRDSIKRRMNRLAVRMGRCTVHGCKLECSHEFWWTGSQLEFEESLALRERLEPYMRPRREKPSGQFCPICRDEPLWCNACFLEEAGKAQPIEIPDSVMSQSEYNRHIELVKMLQRKPPGTPATLFSRDEIHLPSPDRETLTPPPTPMPAHLLPPPPTPQLMPAPVPVVAPPAPTPAPGVDDDDEVAPALATLVMELARQLGRPT